MLDIQKIDITSKHMHLNILDITETPLFFDFFQLLLYNKTK